MLTRPNQSITETRGGWKASLGQKALGLALKAFFLAIDESKIVKPKRLSSQGEAVVLVLPLEANFALLCRAFPSSEAKIASPLAPSGTLSLTSQQRSLALGAVSIPSRQRPLALVVNESDDELATLLTHRGALVLASRAASFALPSSVDDVSEAAVTSLLAKSALALASRDRRGLALQRAEIVLWLEAILASHEAKSREELVDFTTYIAFEEAILGSQETFIASRTALTR